MGWFDSDDTDTSYDSSENESTEDSDDSIDMSDVYGDDYDDNTYTSSEDDDDGIDMTDIYGDSDSSDGSEYDDVDITEDISDLFLLSDPEFDDYFDSLGDDSDALATEIAKLYYEAGDYTTAAGYYALSKIDTLIDTIGAEFSSALGSVFTSSLLQTFSVSNPYVAVGLAILGYATTYSITSTIGDALTEALQASILSGEVTSTEIETLLSGFSDADTSDLSDYFETASSEDIVELIESGTTTYDDYDTRADHVYRRRTNIIGTGLNGLTIE